MVENQKEFNNKLDEIRNNAIIEISTWWGIKNAGYRGTIITENQEVYSYQYYNIVPEELEGRNINFIQKNKTLNIDEYNQIKNFIEDEIINKEFEDERILDAGYDIIVNYNGIRKKIKNNKGLNNDLKIYDKAKILIDELLK